jgi:hypothetical protein
MEFAGHWSSQHIPSPASDLDQGSHVHSGFDAHRLEHVERIFTADIA